MGQISYQTEHISVKGTDDDTKMEIFPTVQHILTLSQNNRMVPGTFEADKTLLPLKWSRGIEAYI